MFKFPEDYFNKWIIRTTAIVLLIFLGYFYFTYGMMSYDKFYMSCSKDSLTQCSNPLYECKYNPNIQNFDKCKFYSKFTCKDNICDTQYIQAGESIGNKPSYIEANFRLLFMELFIIGFGINHLYWHNYKGKKKDDNKPN